MKYKHKPSVIEATQWEGPWSDIEGVVSRHISGDAATIHGAIVEFGIQTLEGFMKVSPGDWIITGVMGERYPCKPDVFKASYEPA